MCFPAIITQDRLLRCWKLSSLNIFLNYCLNKQIKCDICLDFSPFFSHTLATVAFSSSLVRTVVPELCQDICLKMPGYIGVKAIKNLGSFAVWELSTNFMFSVCCSAGVSVRLRWTMGRKELLSGEAHLLCQWGFLLWWIIYLLFQRVSRLMGILSSPSG